MYFLQLNPHNLILIYGFGNVQDQDLIQNINKFYKILKIVIELPKCSAIILASIFSNGIQSLIITGCICCVK